MTGDASEEAETGTEADVQKEELPEPKDPPYTIGERATIQGHYIPLENGISLNFRFLDKRMRVYWVDENDLIVKPQASVGNVRFLASVRGPIYFSMAPQPGEDGLGSMGGPVFVPHLFTVILSLEKPDSEEFDVYTFRYTYFMNSVRETRELVEGETEIEKTDYLIDYKSGSKSDFKSGSKY